ncbi:interleukin-23 receptor isoform X2 [Betta splendens]|uniref:Interleukin-23 receptor isoform X2 n=1 Tax=Betta splendens TaxID=158456 RepID=A0A6P7M5V9_BETSP|nr:interleukin-23 receptor isoform X2 [Betta splendens]
MNQPSIIWRCIIILLIFSIKRCPLAPAGGVRFISYGHLTVEPGPVFLIGSNLTVYCHVTECHSSSIISLHLNDEMVKSSRRINCTTAKFDLISVQKPQSTVICKLQTDQRSRIVSGLDLRGGLPPSKPDSVICETTRSSDVIACSWKRGQQTYLPTTYNVSVSRENGTNLLFSLIRDAEEVSIPRGILDEHTNYQLIIASYNRFGASQCDTFTFRVIEIVMPEIPHIMQVEFGNSSSAAVLRWNTTESSEHLRAHVRLRTADHPWEEREATELHKDRVRVDGLRPLTEYQFQVRACRSASELLSAGATPGPAPLSSPTRGSFCSKWSAAVSGKSPGKGPSQQLRVWRAFSNLDANKLWNVTVLWKPPSPEDFSGQVQRYVIVVGHNLKQAVTCGAALTQCSVPVPGEVPALTVSAVTSYGASPPAVVPMRRSGGFAPTLNEVTPASSGSAVLVSWSQPDTKQQSTSGEELLHYVVEWTSVPAVQLQWLKLDKSQNSTSITGLTPGVRYNISVYTVTSRGVSSPSSQLVYSKQQEPVARPTMQVLVQKTRRLLVQWDELPVNQQKGFITHYTIYIQMLDYSSNVTVSASGPRQTWVDCPEGALALQLTASTSAGEGPPARWVLPQPEAPAAIIANLMCWSCVRKRIKQKCVAWGPAWLSENLPKPGNSNAIRLLELGGSEPSLTCTHSDPPLSPVSLISWEERDDVYPNIHVEPSPPGAERPPSPTTGCRSDAQLEDVSYKPQVATLALLQEEAKGAEEEQGEVSRSDEEDACSVFEGCGGALLSSVEVDFSTSPLVLTLRSVRGLSWPKTSPALNRAFLPVRTETEEDVEVDSRTPDIPPDISLARCSVGTALHCDYFPQVAAVSGSQA